MTQIFETHLVRGLIYYIVSVGQMPQIVGNVPLIVRGRTYSRAHPSYEVKEIEGKQPGESTKDNPTNGSKLSFHRFDEETSHAPPKKARMTILNLPSLKYLHIFMTPPQSTPQCARCHKALHTQHVTRR